MFLHNNGGCWYALRWKKINVACIKVKEYMTGEREIRPKRLAIYTFWEEANSGKNKWYKCLPDNIGACQTVLVFARKYQGLVVEQVWWISSNPVLLTCARMYNNFTLLLFTLLLNSFPMAMTDSHAYLPHWSYSYVTRVAHLWLAHLQVQWRDFRRMCSSE